MGLTWSATVMDAQRRDCFVPRNPTCVGDLHLGKEYASLNDICVFQKGSCITGRYRKPSYLKVLLLRYTEYLNYLRREYCFIFHIFLGCHPFHSFLPLLT